MLVCINCARPIAFGPDGWAHVVPMPDCLRVIVAWPPPGRDDAEDAA